MEPAGSCKPGSNFAPERKFEPVRNIVPERNFGPERGIEHCCTFELGNTDVLVHIVEPVDNIVAVAEQNV